MKSFITKILSLVIAVLLICLMGCGGNDWGEGKAYTITVTTVGGMPLEDITVKVYKDKKLADIAWVAETDEEGKISFTADASKDYFAVLENVYGGYKTQKSYKIDKQSSVISLEAEMLKSDDLSDITYSLGHSVRDFSVTATNGKKYQISDLLKDKKAVVLNFWFINCGPCKMEFPFLQKAYEQYSDEIEVLAINPYDGNKSQVSYYAKENGLTLPMIKGDDGWQTAMQLTAYPTTVVIDRYGSIVMMHRGSVTEDGVFEKIFEYFVSDDYKQSIIRNISDIL